MLLKYILNGFSSKYKVFILLLAVMFTCLYFSFSCLKSEVFLQQNTELNPLVIQKYQKQSLERAAFLKTRISIQGYGALYNALVPEVFCKDLIRIGTIDDGGKWICNPISMLDFPECVIYSLGTNNEPSFEEDLQTFLNNTCKVRSVDKNDQLPETLKRIKNINGLFKKAQIGEERNESGNIYTLNNIISEFGDKRIDILKIDIEGGEFDIINELISAPICQILIEVHGKNATMTLEFLQTLSKNNFFLFSYEINGYITTISEYSFIHNSCLSLFKVNTVFAKYLSK